MADKRIPFPEVLGDKLDQFADWAVTSDQERIGRRIDLPFEEVVDFYDRLLPHVDEIMSYLRTRPVDNPSIEDINLVNVMKSLVEVSDAVEIYGQGAIPDAGDLRNYASRLDRDLVGSDRA
jgi:hypothetical protein